MIPVGQSLPAGYCQHCREECRDRLGADVFPERPELADKVIWECIYCGARVGSHEEGKNAGKALGTAANPELRRARQLLHGRIDPLWEKAHMGYADAKAQNGPERIKAMAIIKRTARKRVYDFLQEKMGLSAAECDVALFSLEQCRMAWRALEGVAYSEIRGWAKARKASGSPPGEGGQP